MRWLLVFASLALSASSESSGGSKKCKGSYANPVVNLCSEHWPDAKSTRVWMVVFYTSWCGHCRALEPKYKELGKLLKNDKSIGIGAVDCDIDRATCSKYGVSGFPALKAIVSGKGKSYNGARETEPMKAWIEGIAKNRGTKGGSAKCAVGLFKSRVKDAVVPLCEEHFPDDKAKNDWLVLFYNSKSSTSTDLKEVLHRLAVDLGNDPPDMSKSLKKPKKKRERLESLAEKYDFAVDLPKKGPFGMDALAKVGGVCCDCNEDAVAFCASSLRIGEEDVQAPQVFWVSKGHRELLKDADMSAPSLNKLAVTKLGFFSGSRASQGSEL
mmetsp:Transcript_34035/g.79318  ORF Transcript_34035/g.79318 Transcript_34035/m.79318 type:complete len:326 (-) Transcript_34035:241-1218(-)